MVNPIVKMKPQNFIHILTIFITVFHKIKSTPFPYEEFYIFPNIYLKFYLDQGSDNPTELVIEHSYTSTSKSPMSVDPDIYNHIRKYEFLLTATNSPENEEQRVQEMNKIHELCHAASELEPKTVVICPRETLIYPCKCDEIEQSLNCSNVNSFSDLKLILNKDVFPTTIFDRFTYYPASPSDEQSILLNNTFGSLSFTNMLFVSSGVVKVEANAFSGSEGTLQVIYFDNNNKIAEFPFQEILNNFHELNSIYLFKGAIRKVPRLKSTSLEYLDLNTNLISTLEYDTFQYLPLLKNLDLSYNEVETIGPRGWVFSANILIYIDHNKITSISPFASYQPSIFDVNSNMLTSFNQEVFEPILKQKYFVDVQANDISCTELEWATGDPNYSPFLTSDC